MSCDNCDSKGCADCGYAGVEPCPHKPEDPACKCSVRQMNAAQHKRAKNDEFADYMQKLADTQGCACSTVKDGHLLLFKHSFLRELVDKNPDKEYVIMFVKRPDFKN